MCDTCGCNLTPDNVHLVQSAEHGSPTQDGHETLAVLRNLLHANEQTALHNRQHFEQHGVLTVNLMSSPGAGKTALLEATIEALQGQLALAVIEGDLETERDASRIRSHGVPAVQITTGSACHLDAHMVHKALHDLALAELDLLFIENVGNLVCPASFDLGQHRNVVLLSTPEGDDKPAKYPVMFRAADLVLVSKCDLLPILDDFRPENVRRHLQALANPAPLIEVSARSGTGLDQWLQWLAMEQAALEERLASPQAVHYPSSQAEVL
jgi:hydrogenase nickel incorporation protein HypB